MAKIKWPNGAKCAVMLSFDVDGQCLGGKDEKGQSYPRSISYGRYGPVRGVERIVDILEARDLPATFFVPARTAVDFPSMFKDLNKAGYEIGHHGFDHELFSGLTYEQQENIIDRSQEAFDRLIGKTAKVFRTPSGDFTKDTPRLLIDKGFIGSSSMRGDDRPYRTVIDGKETDLIEMPPKWEMDDYPYFGYDFYPVKTLMQHRICSYDLVLDNWKREFDGCYKEGLMFIVMNHPQVIGRPGRSDVLRELIDYIRAHEDVWFTTAGDLANWWRKNY